MRPISAIAVGAVSTLGRGERASAVGGVGAEPPSGLELDAAFSALRHPLVGRVAAPPDEPGVDRAIGLLLVAASDLRAALDSRVPSWRTRRLGLVVGTSAGAMPSLTRALAIRASGASLPATLARRASYAAPLDELEQYLGLPRGSGLQVLGACASSTLALGIGARWLDAGQCELVIAGGYDALSDFVAAGFDALGALTASEPRPFQRSRDGMALGEGAALVALARAEPGDGALGRILGFSASSDAVHITAPDREGRGLLRAAEGALADAGLGATDVGFVSAHATATPYNDAAEARALTQLFGERMLRVQPWKAVIGHTLGAAGVLETLAAWDALGRGVAPGTPGQRAPGAVEFSSLELAQQNTAAQRGVALKLSAAFGGANAALVLGAPSLETSSAQRARHPVSLGARSGWFVEADAARVARFGAAAASIASRADDLSALALTAVASLIESLGEPLGDATALVLGSEGATLELDELFDCRRREGRPVEPRRFPPTSPNVGAGSCCIAFGFRGPAFAAGGGPGRARDALLLAYDLVAAGDAPAAVAVHVEDTGPTVKDLFEAAGFAAPTRGARALLLLRGSETSVSRQDLAWEV